MRERPNVLMIVVDCLRSDRVFGDKRTCRTPNIDKLVSRGLNLPNMFTETSITGPCFASMFTGCSCLGHGLTALLGRKLNSGLTTLADVFKDNGYSTYAHITGPLMPIMGLNQGFDEYEYRQQNDYYFSAWGRNLIRRFEQRKNRAPWFSLVHFWEIHEPRQAPPGFDLPEFGWSDYDRAVSALDEYVGTLVEAAGEDAVVIFTGDHGERIEETVEPATILPYFLEKLDIKTLQCGDNSGIGETLDLLNLQGEVIHDLTYELGRHERETDGVLSIPDRLKLLVKFFKIGLARMKTHKYQPGKESFGEFFRAKLDDIKTFIAVSRGDGRAGQIKLLRTTLGEAQLQHGFHIYDYLHRIPFVIKGLDSYAKGKIFNGLVKNFDVLPTLCELLSLSDVPRQGQGSSFVNRLEGESEDPTLYLETRAGSDVTYAFYVRGLRQGNYKLAYAPNDPKAPRELYDIKLDPDEKNNILDDNLAVADKLRDQAEELAISYCSTSYQEAVSDEEEAETIAKLKSLGYM